MFLDQVPYLRSVPSISTWPEIEDTANGLLEEAYYGGGSGLEVAVELETHPIESVRLCRDLMGAEDRRILWLMAARSWWA